METIVEDSGIQRVIAVGRGCPEKTLSIAIFVAAGGKSSRLAETVAHRSAVPTARLSRRMNEKNARRSGPIERERLALTSVPWREMIVRSDRRLLRRTADSARYSLYRFRLDQVGMVGWYEVTIPVLC